MAARAVVLFAHGARHPEWAGPFARLKAELAALRPGERVELAFLELMPPSLPDCAAALHADGIRELRIVPVFLGFGGHLKHDLPQQVESIQDKFPDLRITLEAPIGEQPEVISAIARAIAG